MQVRREQIIPAIFLAAWAVSSCLPVAVIREAGQDRVIHGLSMLAGGWLGPLMFQFAWYANLLVPAAVFAVARDRDRSSSYSFIVLGGLLVIFAIQALTWDGDYGSGFLVEIRQYRMGYFLWLVGVFGTAIWLCGVGWRNRSRGKDLL